MEHIHANKPCEDSLNNFKIQHQEYNSNSRIQTEFAQPRPSNNTNFNNNNIANKDLLAKNPNNTKDLSENQILKNTDLDSKVFYTPLSHGIMCQEALHFMLGSSLFTVFLHSQK